MLLSEEITGWAKANPYTELGQSLLRITPRIQALEAQAERDGAVIEAARMVVGSELLRDIAWTDALKRLDKAIRLHDEKVNGHEHA